MNRRHALHLGAASLLATQVAGPAQARQEAASAAAPAWPSDQAWADLAASADGQVQRVEWPIQVCIDAPSSAGTEAFFRSARNPYFLGDHPGLTQTFGWTDAWFARPSAHVVVARSAADIAKAVSFVRRHKLRLIVKGGGHSYHGTSNAPDSLLVWTRHMDRITLHDRFVPSGCAGRTGPVPAVSVEAGAIWAQVYQEVTTRAGRYVQGGGCLTVGVAGLIQGGGFGSFSKAYGLAAASLLEAEMVTADGAVRTVNACSDPGLFFALKGGGGGTFGIVTRMTLRTHDLPATFGAVFAEITAASDEHYRDLIREVIAFYSRALFNPHWGEQLSFRPDNMLAIAMVFQGRTQGEAAQTWAPFFDWIAQRPHAFRLASGPVVLAVPAGSFWDADLLKTLPGIILTDDRPGAGRDRIFWASNREEAGQVIHAYQSAWVPADLLAENRQEELVDALHAASRHWSISLHTNKGLAGAPPPVRDAALRTAVNPVVVNSFALAICAAEGPPAYPGVTGHEPDLALAGRQADQVGHAMAALQSRAAVRGAYLPESDYFQQDWQSAYWGPHYARLLAVKRMHDPDGLFRVHHGVGMDGCHRQSGRSADRAGLSPTLPCNSACP